MKRFCLISSAAAASLLALAPVANAEPAILYIPTEEITLRPSGIVDTPCEFVSTSQYNPGLGCFPGLEMETTEPPYADAEMLTMSIATALEAFDIHVTNERPPAYLPHYMLLASDDVSKEGTSYSCAGAAENCGTRGRNGIATTSGGTMNCMDPDALQAALYAVGRMAGLEGSVNPDDPMHYPPDFMTPASEFQDQCDSIAPLIDPKTMMPLPAECTSADHNGCDMGEQNTVADLMAYYGARVEDADPPVLSGTMPMDGQDFPDQSNVLFSVTVEDADPIVGVSFTITSPVFDEAYGGDYTICTNNHCDRNLIEGDPFAANDGPWEAELGPLPGGTYEVTIEAADYHGNVAEPLTFSFTVNGGMSGESGDVTDTDPMTSSATTPMTSTFTSTAPLDTTDTNDDESGGEATGENMEDDSGCNCSQSSGAGGAFMIILGLFGFAATRRRD